MLFRSPTPSVLFLAVALAVGPGLASAHAAPVTATQLAQFLGVTEAALDAPKPWSNPQSTVPRNPIEGSGLLSPVFIAPAAQPPEYLFLSFQVQLLSDQPQCDPANCPNRDSVYAVLERVGYATSVLEVMSTSNPMPLPGAFGYDRATTLSIGLGWSGFVGGEDYRIGFAVVDGDDPGGDSGLIVDNVELRRLQCPNNVCLPGYDVVWSQSFEQGWGAWTSIGATEIAGCSPFVASCAALLRTDGSSYPPLDPGDDVPSVPEPGTLALLATGLAGAFARRRTQRTTTRAAFFSAVVFVSGLATATHAGAAPIVYTGYDAFLAATTTLSTDDFDTAPWAEGNYAGPVTSAGTTWSSANTLRSTTVLPRSGSLALSDVDGSPDLPDTILATLPSGTTAAGVWVRGVSWLQGEFSAIAGDGTVVASWSGWIPDSYVFLGAIDDTAIHQIRVRALAVSGDDFIVDDFVRGSAAAPSAVPEPGTLALLLPGLAVAIRRIRR